MKRTSKEVDSMAEALVAEGVMAKVAGQILRKPKTKSRQPRGLKHADVWSQTLQFVRLEERLAFSHLGDPAILVGFTNDPALSQIQSQPPTENTGPTPSGFASYSTLANGMPVLNSLSSAPTAIYLDFDGDASGSNPYTAVVNPYSEDADGTTFNVAEQRSIYEAWRQTSSYFAMFDINVTTIMPASSIPKAWLAVGNNISGGYSYVNVFPNSTPESWNQSSDARTRVSGITHELGHNLGLQHQATYDQWGVKTAEYASAKDALHGALMGVDYSGTVHKFISGHNSTSSGVTTLQDDIAVIANKIKTYQPAGGDGFRADDFPNTLAAAAPLSLSGASQWTSGIVERLADVDAFSFTSGGGVYAISAAPDTPSGVDLKLEVYSADGRLIAAKDSANNVQELSLELLSGTYYATVSSHQNYGDLGRYFLSVSSLPSGWKSTEVGLGTSGYTVFDSAIGIFNPVGSGAGLTSTSDGFQYAYQTLNGDGSIVARVTNVDNTSANAVVGVTMRETTAANSRHVSIGKTYGGGPKQFVRSSSGSGTTTTTAAAGSSTHTWLKLQRVGNAFTTFTSSDGATWTQLGTVTIAMSTSLTVGLLTASNNNHAMNVGELDSVVIVGNTSVLPATYNNLPAPTGVSVTLGTGSGLNLSWNPVLGATGYTVSRSADGVNFTQIGTPATTSYSDPNLAGSARYFYRIAATDLNGNSEPSGIVSLVNRPSAVTGLSVTKPNATQLVLDWTETTGETGYRIQRSIDGGVTFTTIATLGANVPGYTDSGLSSALVYSYIVTPTSGLGDGVTSASISATPRLAAVNPVIGAVATGSITINWPDIANETGYRIERSLDGTTFTTLANVGANVVSYADTTVASATEYYYRVYGTTTLTQSLTGTVKFAASASTSPPLAPWTSVDLGSVSGPGTTDLTGSTFKLISSGTAFGGTSDSGRLTSQPISGDGEVVARVASIENTASGAMAGVMIRQSNVANSAHAFVYVTPTSIGFSYRSTTGGSTTTVATVAATAPNWVKLNRTGNSFAAFYSADGVSWTQIGGSTSISMTSSAVAGIASTAGVSTLLNTSTLTNVSVNVSAKLSVNDVTQVEGDSGTSSFVFTVTLSAASNSNVSVDYATAAGTATSGSDFTAALGTITFLPGETSKTIPVTVSGDLINEANETFFVNLSNPVNSAIFDGQGVGTIQNDDIATITVGNPSPTATTEAGGTASFTVVLGSQPLADVTIPISSSNPGEGSVTPAWLTFTAVDWNIPQTVTVTGVDDLVDDGNQLYSIVLAAATSADSSYNGLKPADVALTNTDNDTAGIVVGAPSGNQTTESGGIVTFTIGLNSQPLSDVTIPLSSSNPNEGTVSSASLIFTSANWNVLQTITVTGVDDLVYDGNVSYTVVIGAASSADAVYNGLNPSDIQLTNIDNDPIPSTKFYVVDDVTADRTYEYSESGAAIENYRLASGNTAPRGSVATSAGDKIWVVDKNRNVYVYNNSGGLLGSWTAGTIASNATVEGIATDGTNIWIVDSKSDKIYYYSGAATRLSGSVAATASFALNSGNTSPKDLVFGRDDSNQGFIWVVNDSTVDKVFRYSVTTSGAIAFLNSWNLNLNNKAPTGITLDPGSTTGDLWVLDNGTSKQVYRYTDGRAVTGSTSPVSSAVFTVVGLTSPQGIADPPPAADRAAQAVLDNSVESKPANRLDDLAAAGYFGRDFSKTFSASQISYQRQSANGADRIHTDLLDEVMSSWSQQRSQASNSLNSPLELATALAWSDRKDEQLYSSLEDSDSFDEVIERSLELLVSTLTS